MTYGNLFLILSFFILVFVSNIVTVIFALYFNFIWLGKDGFNIWFSIFYFSIVFVSNITVYLLARRKIYIENKGYNKSAFLIFIFILSFILLLISNSKTMSRNILNLASFAETPKQSSWYLLHNAYSGPSIYGSFIFTEHELLRIKKIFKCQDAAEMKCNEYLTGKENAIYGYMLWGLGEVKLLCPSDARFDGDKVARKRDMEKCLLIERKFLQPISEAFFR